MRLINYDFFKRLAEKVPFFKKRDAASEKLNRDELEFLPAALEVVQTPPSPIGRTIVWFLIGVFITALIWACVGHIYEVAVAQGKVIPSGYTKTFQAFDTGVVKKIHVKDGSKVKAGDILIELDATMTQADLDRYIKELNYYKLETKRLLTEQSGQLFSIGEDLNIDNQEKQYQLLLYNTRKIEYQAKTAAAQQVIGQAKARLESVQATKAKLVYQLEIAQSKENAMKQLLDVGAVGLFQYLDCKQQRIGYQQDLAAKISDIKEANSSLFQSIEALNNTKSEWDRYIAEKLVENQRQMQSIEEELNKAREKNRLSTIVSPITGTVHQLAVHTVGGVITPVKPLMLIVPEGARWR